jgi:hypothetical protein
MFVKNKNSAFMGRGHATNRKLLTLFSTPSTEKEKLLLARSPQYLTADLFVH